VYDHSGRPSGRNFNGWLRRPRARCVRADSVILVSRRTLKLEVEVDEPSVDPGPISGGIHLIVAMAEAIVYVGALKADAATEIGDEAIVVPINRATVARASEGTCGACVVPDDVFQPTWTSNTDVLVQSGFIQI